MSFDLQLSMLQEKSCKLKPSEVTLVTHHRRTHAEFQQSSIVFWYKPFWVAISSSWYSRAWAVVTLSWARGGPQPARVQPLRRKRYRLPSSSPWICHWVASARLMFTSLESTTSIVVLLTMEEARKMSGQLKKPQKNLRSCMLMEDHNNEGQQLREEEDEELSH